MTDDDVDRLFPKAVQKLSRAQWTPVKVALRAAAFLAESGRVLDVGAGSGKFCLVGAISTRAHFTGVEKAHGRVARRADERPDLADELARLRRADRARRAVELVRHFGVARQNAVRITTGFTLAEERRARRQLHPH